MYTIIKSVDLPGYLAFKSECDCLGHDLHVTVEKDEFGSVSLGFRDTYCASEERMGPEAPWYSKLWYRFKFAVHMLLTGYCDIDYEFIFKNEAHVDEFLQFLNESIKSMKENSQEE